MHHHTKFSQKVHLMKYILQIPFYLQCASSLWSLVLFSWTQYCYSLGNWRKARRKISFKCLFKIFYSYLLQLSERAGHGWPMTSIWRSLVEHWCALGQWLNITSLCGNDMRPHGIQFVFCLGGESEGGVDCKLGWKLQNSGQTRTQRFTKGYIKTSPPFRWHLLPFKRLASSCLSKSFTAAAVMSLSTAMASLMATFDRYAAVEGKKDTLTKLELKNLVENEMPCLIQVE